MKLYYFSVPVDALSPNHALAKAQQFLTSPGQHLIMTPNPEMIVKATKDPFFLKALQAADLSLVDGTGLALALSFLSGERVRRIPGADFLTQLLKSNQSPTRFFFLGGEHGVSKRAAQVTEKQFGAKVVGTYEPKRGAYDFHNELTVLDPEEHQKIIDTIRSARPDFLVVALGQVFQEKWMQAYVSSLPTVRVAMGVGGTLDYLAEATPRAPHFMRAVGLEWVWRLFNQPHRLSRIIDAVIRFPVLTIRYYFASRLRYRQCVVGCVINERHEILVVSRVGHTDHWQFPQGGREDNETPQQAVLREMREELGTDKLTIIGQSRPNVYRYSWKKTWPMIQSGPTPDRHYGYRGQSVTVFFLKFTGNDNEIRLDNDELNAYRWILPTELFNVLHPIRQPLARCILPQLHDHLN